MVRTDRRGKRSTGGKQNNDDFYRIRIIMFLLSNHEATLPELRKNGEYGIGRMGRGRLKKLLDTMVAEKWLQPFQEKHSSIQVYALLQKGEDMVNLIRNTDENNPLFELNAFRNVKSLGTSNE